MAMNTAADIDVLPTGFSALNLILGGGFTFGTITLLAGYPHAAKTIALTARSIAAEQGRPGGYLRVLPSEDEDRSTFPLRLWSTVAMLLMQGTEVLVVEGVTPVQLRALPSSLKGLVQRRHRLLLITVATPPVRRAFVSLTFRPGGWLYRQQQVNGYRTVVTLYPTTSAPLGNKITLEIPLSSYGSISL